jgi:2-amino-4-hydroxy-6-hydroxymethyldihydropteridine diphosphokinase
MTRVFIGLGGNIGDPVAQVLRAAQEIAALPHASREAMSALYRTAPVGHLEQPPFINAVLAVQTEMSPRELMRLLRQIETRAGRVRGIPNGPRTLDLDILMYGDLVLSEPDLVIPHPRMHDRAFVLLPLAEIAPALLIPERGYVRSLIQVLADKDLQGVVRLAAPETAVSLGG